LGAKLPGHGCSGTVLATMTYVLEFAVMASRWPLPSLRQFATAPVDIDRMSVTFTCMKISALVHMVGISVCIQRGRTGLTVIEANKEACYHQAINRDTLIIM
jgi:hypothetical protein